MNLKFADDTGMFYGLRFYNELLMEAGEFGNVRSEILLQKDKSQFTLKEGWAFPRRVYFNGDECSMPLPDAYPFLPNSAPLNRALDKIIMFTTVILSLVIML